MRLYLAISHASKMMGKAVQDVAIKHGNPPELSILSSFHYIRSANRFFKNFPMPTQFKMIDSGAYSAWTLGKPINLKAYEEEIRTNKWDEAVALDSIGDWKGSVANAMKMKAEGFPNIIPVFHYGEPWHVLELYCAEFPKVGLSCLLGELPKDSYRWLDGCFSKQWPHKFHSFGWAAEKVVMRYPFHSADSSTWNSVGRFRTIVSMKSLKLKTSSPKEAMVDVLRDSVEHSLDVQRRAKQRWAATWKEIETKANK